MTRPRFDHPAVLLLSLLSLVAVAARSASADDWPQWRGPTRDGVWRETGLVETFAEPQLKIKWRAPVGPGYSGPTIAKGRVYVTDRLVEPKQVERIHCFDEQTGQQLWTHEYDCIYKGVGYDAGPRASVLIEDGRAYSLGSMGNFLCLDAATGKVLWEKDLNTLYNIQMPIWGIAASPIIEGPLVIVVAGGENACLVAFDKVTGEERWKALDDPAQYSAPIVVQQGGKRVLVCWTAIAVVGVNPATGEEYWRVPLKPIKMPIGITTPVVAGDRLFVSSFYDGALMVQLSQDRPAAEQLWHRRGASEDKTDALHAIISTPLMVGDLIYGVDSYGQLRCLDAKTGDRIWENLTATPKARWSTIHTVTNGDRVWMFNERGELLIGKLSPTGFEEISRTKLIAPTTGQLGQRGGVCWSHPGYANRHIFARNDEEIVCASLAAGD
jgi:outer membrane protein assembly factor BamB